MYTPAIISFTACSLGRWLGTDTPGLVVIAPVITLRRFTLSDRCGAVLGVSMPTKIPGFDGSSYGLPADLMSHP